MCTHTCTTTYLPELCVSNCDPNASVSCEPPPAPVWAWRTLHRDQRPVGWGVYQVNPGLMGNAPIYYCSYHSDLQRDKITCKQKSQYLTIHCLIHWITFHEPKELWDGPRKELSDWLGCDRWAEKNGEACGLIGGEGEGELKGAELLKDPGMLTGAELWSWLPPIKGKETNSDEFV